MQFQLIVDWIPIDKWKPVDLQLENHNVGPFLNSTEFISGQAPRSFASIEGNAWGADPEMNSVNANGIPETNGPITHHSNRLPIFLNIHPLAEVQDCKGTPFEDFPRVLSTNRKPAFRALDQWEASISARFWTSAKLWTIQCIANQIVLHVRSNGVCFHCQWNANLPPMECQLTTNWMSIDSQWNANWFQMKYVPQ